MGTTTVYWGYIEIMEKKIETTIVCWCYIGIMEIKMETIVEKPNRLIVKLLRLIMNR